MEYAFEHFMLVGPKGIKGGIGNQGPPGTACCNPQFFVCIECVMFDLKAPVVTREKKVLLQCSMLEVF